MDLGSMSSNLAGLSSQQSNIIDSNMTSQALNDPMRSLKLQRAMQEFSIYVSFESAMIKNVKDLLTGIIAKI